MDVPEYKFVLHEDGTGTYTASALELAARQDSSYAQQIAVRPLTQFSASYKLPAKLVGTLFSQVRAANLAAGDCASKAKNLANTGTKTLLYTGSKGTGQCIFNYTQNKSVASAAETFQAMSFTLNAGRVLAHDEIYDRLGLDHEMNTLVEALKDGRAQVPGLIAPELTLLISNDQVMDRVRRNAAILLDKASAER